MMYYLLSPLSQCPGHNLLFPGVPTVCQPSLHVGQLVKTLTHTSKSSTIYNHRVPITYVRVISCIYLRIFKHLLQALLHLLEFTRLDATVGQQHASELSLGDSAVHRIVPLELEMKGKRETW